MNMTTRIPKAGILITLLLIISLSCGTTESLKDEMPGPTPVGPSEEISEAAIEEFSETERLLYENRTHMADRFSVIEPEIPETFLREAAVDDRVIDETAGYRVQIISTRDVAHADSIRDGFRVWALDRIEGYEPGAYIIFRQPYYRVRVGDFNDRRMAIDFSNLLKNRYPDAWIVHDRIDPELTPADTSVIRFRSIETVSE
ncbi:MAG: SPOR domain-containing protein [Balneolaceae bacterium]|nr:MAG: SPOR domain-containing protein [Balneolaceae bacterium]